MGFFSWKTSDTQETIWNIYSEKKQSVFGLLMTKEINGLKKTMRDMDFLEVKIFMSY